MLLVILFTAPLTIPKLFGIQIYAVLSGSMEPEYPIGSVVYVKTVQPEQIQVGDVITFQLPEEADVVMTHRVVEMDTDAMAFLTKGDANEQVDEEEVDYERLIGKAVFCIPELAIISNLLNTTTGKAIAFSLFALSFICWVLADLLKPRKINNTASKKLLKDEQNLRDENSEMESERSENPLQNRKRNQKPSLGILLLRLVFGILILIAVIGLTSSAYEYYIASREYRELQQIVKETPAEKKEEQKKETQEDAEKVFRPNESIAKKFQALQQTNPEMTAWVAFDTLNISYPVMHGVDNTYYLTHTFSGKTNSSGSIFMEAGNSGDFTDYHTLLYGHNMKNGSMFGLLKKYREEEFYPGNEFFTIYLQDRYLRYQIFSVHTVSITDPVYTIGFAPNQEFEDFVDRLNRQAWYETGIQAGGRDKIVTLSTCSSSDTIRYVVHAVMFEEVEFE